MLLTDRKATLRDLRKGFVFFMDQEKKDIKKYVAAEKAKRMMAQTYEVDAPKVWWEDEQLFRPITEWTLQKNEWLEVEASEQREAYAP